MKNGRLISTVLLLLAPSACDKTDDAKARTDAKPAVEPEAKAEVDAEAKEKIEANAMIGAEAEAQEGVAVAAAIDLDAIVDEIEQGKIESAADLEASLAAEDEAVAKVDIDDDGKTDRLHVVERRSETATTFEVRAVAAEEAKLEVEAAPLVASFEFAAKADVGVVEARASYSAEFAAKAELDVEATAVTRTYSGVSVNAEGSMEVEASANVFVAWAFEVERPAYVAEVFVVVKDEKKPAAKDPCWPPGHCKHDLWKARGELPPGQQAKLDDEPEKANEKHDNPAKADHGKPEKADHGKPDKHQKPDKHDNGKVKGKGNDKSNGNGDSNGKAHGKGKDK